MVLVRLLVLSDLHGAVPNLEWLIAHERPDLIIIPGDLPSSVDIPILLLTAMSGGRRNEYVRRAYYQFTERLSYTQVRSARTILEHILDFEIPTLLIHGNTETKKTRSWLSLFAYRYPNLHYISDDYFIINDICFVGSGWTPYYEEHGREKTSGEISDTLIGKTLQQTIDNIDPSEEYSKSILVSHSPPYNTKLDYLPNKDLHVGSKEIKKILYKNIFDGIICGHIHEAHGHYTSKKKNWWGVNAGALIEDIACIIDLDNNYVKWYNKMKLKWSIDSLIYRNKNS